MRRLPLPSPVSIAHLSRRALPFKAHRTPPLLLLPPPQWHRRRPHDPHQPQQRHFSALSRGNTEDGIVDDTGISSLDSDADADADADSDAYDAEFPCGERVVEPKFPFRFETGVALFAKRTPRPFPPPFLSPPSGSFSDPLSTHHRSRDRRAFVNGERIRGCTNGDDAVYASTYFIGANDGVGAWSTRPHGHAGLWARLVLHFWARAIYEDARRARPAAEGPYHPDPVACLQRAYEQTIEATSTPNDWQGTTTAAGAQLFYRKIGTGDDNSSGGSKEGPHGSGSGGTSKGVEPLLYVTNLGDSQVMVVRPAEAQLVFKTKEQWHWFDCPRQLGTNSPDTPRVNAVLDAVPIREGDVVLAMSDGVIDNLWPHEIVENVSNSVEKWEKAKKKKESGHNGDNNVGELALPGGEPRMMDTVAENLMEAARTVAMDPFAESPFMEHAIEEGLASEGGKMDDISVVAAICRRND